MGGMCADISDPVNFYPPRWVDTVQGYIGERVPIRTPTPYIWSNSDWHVKFGNFRKYPMFVASPAVGNAGNAVTEAFECMEALYQIGCLPGRRWVVGLDMETAVAPGYVTTFFQILHDYQYRLWVYGSASSVFKNPVCDGYDVADWSGVKHFAAGKAVRATQYADAQQSGIGADLRVIRPWQYSYTLWR